jgi:spore coat protein U-like protein
MPDYRLIVAIAAAAGAAAPFAAWAGTTTATVDARLRVDTSCRLFTEPLAFGTVNVNSVSVDATSTVRLSCGPSVAYSVAIDNGLYFNGERRMYGGVGNLYTAYEIYRNAARTLVWGSGANQLSGVTPADGEVTLTLYGRVPDTRKPSRPYIDQVTVTVSF